LSELIIRNRLTICTSFLSRQKKQFLYQIVTGDKKWIYYDNPKKSWIWGPGQSSTSILKTQHPEVKFCCAFGGI